MDKLFVHSTLCVHKVTLVDDDVIKVVELVGMANHAADGGEGDSAYILLVERCGVYGYIQYAVAAHLLIVLLQYLFGWLEHKRMPFETICNVTMTSDLPLPVGSTSMAFISVFELKKSTALSDACC